jgi:hypothetical protein
MLQWLRHAVVICALAGCGDATSPGTRLSGTYGFVILFDGRPTASGDGTLTFEQPDANDPALRITGSFTATPINGTMSRFRAAKLSADNVVRFLVEAPYPWEFEGQLLGDLVVGTHVLVGGGLSGSWRASKIGTPGPPPPP